MVSHLRGVEVVELVVEEGWREGLNHHMGNKVVDGWMDGWLVGHAVVLLSSYGTRSVSQSCKCRGR